MDKSLMAESINSLRMDGLPQSPVGGCGSRYFADAATDREGRPAPSGPPRDKLKWTNEGPAAEPTTGRRALAETECYSTMELRSYTAKPGIHSGRTNLESLRP